MPEKNIPQINQDFDIKLVRHVLTKNIIWIIFLLAFAISSAFIIIRYTKPIYYAKSVIQLTSKDKTSSSVLDAKLNPYITDNLAEEMELLRSPVFLNRVTAKIPADINYNVKGAILNFENYKSSPYYVQYGKIDPSIYNLPLVVEIEDSEYFNLSSEDLNFNKKIKFGDTVNISKTEFKIMLKPDRQAETQEKYFFTFNNPQHFINELLNSLKVNILSEPAKTIEISYTGANPQKVVDIVNGVAMEFEYFNIEKKQESANRVLQYIDKTLGIVSTSLNENEKELNKYKPNEVDDIYLLQMEQSKNFDLIYQMNEDEASIKNDSSILKRIGAIPINGRNDVVNIHAIISGTGIESSLTGILDNFTTLYNTADDLSYNATEGSSLLDKNKFQIEQLKQAYTSAINSLEKVLNEKLEALKSSRKGIKINKQDVRDTSNLSASMVKRIKEVNEKYYNQLIEKKAEYAIAKEGFTPEYQILEFASIPEEPIAPNKQMIMLSAIGLWLLLSLLLVGVKYVLKDQILLLNDISKYTDAPILGMIHKYKQNIPVSQLVVDKAPKGRIAEAFRTARTNLQFIYNEPGPKVISLTSTISGEGKTFVSINLAGILAFSGNRVVIIDCDMRKPKIHVGFETDNEIGMSTILIGKNTIDECIRKSQMENLHFITAGPIPPNPAELLLTQRMDELVKELKTKYDYIVIDNPPSGLVSDAIVNLQRADYPIYVFRSDYSRKFFINNLIRLKEENRITQISCILNSVELQRNKNYGNSGYGYGSYNYGYGSGYGFGYYDEEDGEGARNPNNLLSRLFEMLRGKKN